MTKFKRVVLGIKLEISRTYCLCLADDHVQERVQSTRKDLNARKRDLEKRTQKSYNKKGTKQEEVNRHVSQQSVAGKLLPAVI
jgi:hypothetical protein